MDCPPSLTWQKADISLPTKTLFETGGCLVNNTGYLQRATPVFKGGSPIQQTGANSHPPRIHTAQIPGNGTQTARQWAESILSSPIKMTEDEEALCALMLQATPEKSISALPRDTHQPFPSLSSLAAAMTRPEESEQGEVLITGSVFGSDRLANLGELGQQLVPAPEIWVHTDLATTLGLEENQMVLVPLAHGVARGILRCSRNMNTLTVVLAKTPASDWQRVGKQAVSFDIKRIWREQADQDAVAAADFDPDISCQGGRL
jgi:NADH-quinone oxidoreductase subunit G